MSLCHVSLPAWLPLLIIDFVQNVNLLLTGDFSSRLDEDSERPESGGHIKSVPGFELLVLWFYLVLHLMKAVLSVWECHDLAPKKTEFRGRSLAKMVATCRITILCITCVGFKHIEETDCDG